MLERQEIENLNVNGLMRRAFSLAVSARTKGNHPFGALLCDLAGTIVLEAENTVGAENDVTRHAEQNLMSAASRKFSKDELSRLVMITSTEPCAMCAGATFWTGVRAVVYGLPEIALCEMCAMDANPLPPVLNLPCEKVFAACPGHPTVVLGPILEEEARVPHDGFW
ncbi:guanine deaminase [mine drainage metagenome]|uniref:Guanine deaminase n=1 Tax=mine drainage metagenome TaxID=410659 RepID=A0A1J5PXG0_9ZZZZ